MGSAGVATVVISSLLAAGCASVLGIEDLTTQDGGATGSGTTGTTASGGGTTGGMRGSTGATSAGTGSATTGTGASSTSGGASAGTTGAGTTASATGGTGSDGGAATTGGASTGTTGSASASDGGAANTTGRDGGGTSTGTTGRDGGTGTTGTTGTTTGATTGTTGTTGSTTGGSDGGTGTINVVGTIIDFGRHPFPNVPVIISSGGTMLGTIITGSDGKFRMNNVPTPYEVSFVAVTANGYEAQEGWRYEGLTTSTPYLQTHIDAALQSEDFDLTFTGAGPDDTVSFDLGSADTSSPGDTTGNETNRSVYWNTNPTTTGTMHALRWSPGDPPSGTQYLGYGTASMSLDSTVSGYQPQAVPVNQGVTAAQISGTVTPAMSGQTLAVDVYLTFADNARIPLFTDITPGANGVFTVPTPAIPNATISVVARGGDWYSGSVGVGGASKHALATNATGIALQIPKAPLLAIPVSSATIAKTATFSWSGATPDPTVYIFSAEFASDTAQNMVFNVVTTKTQTTLPTFPGTGFDIPTVTNCQTMTCPAWHVETRSNTITTVDQAVSAPGMLDAIDDYGNSSTGALDGIDDRDIVHTYSEYRSFHF